MTNNAFFELLKTRRSIRKFSSEQISEEQKALLMKAALMAPTAKHCNAWEFVIVEQADTICKLSECRPTGSQFMKHAPLVVVVAVNKEKSTAWVEDASIASAFIQLQAHSMGLGSCWVQVNGRMKDETVDTENYIRALLGMPETLGIVCMIAIGYPAEHKNAFEEDKLQFEKVHNERYHQK